MLAGPVTDLMTKSGRQPTPMRLPVPTLLSSMSSATALAGSTRAPSVYVPSEMGAGVPVREVVWHSFGASAFTLAVPMGTRAAELEVRNSSTWVAPGGALVAEPHGGGDRIALLEARGTADGRHDEVGARADSESRAQPRVVVQDEFGGAAKRVADGA